MVASCDERGRGREEKKQWRNGIGGRDGGCGMSDVWGGGRGDCGGVERFHMAATAAEVKVVLAAAAGRRRLAVTDAASSSVFRDGFCGCRRDASAGVGPAV
eukprot:scaffold31695_cov118-Isochrysis_galbana.AAC.2